MLKWKASLLIGVLSLSLVGCNQVENNAEHHPDNNNPNETQPVRFESRQERTERNMGQLGNGIEQVQYPQDKQSKYHTGDRFTDPYSNEESVYIYHQLMKRNEIVNAQVASTEDRIIVSVMLEPHFNHESKPSEEDIEEYVREIVPTTKKDIVVYTDDPEWDKRKNNNARWNNRAR